jgi:hypothetical protein
MSRSDSDSEDSDDDDDFDDDEGDPTSRRERRRRRRRRKKGDASAHTSKSSRPSYKSGSNYQQDASDVDEDEDDESTSIFSGGNYGGQLPNSLLKQRHISESAGTHRLQRILKESGVNLGGPASATDYANQDDNDGDPLDWVLEERKNRQAKKSTVERIPDAKNATHVARFCSKVVLPPFKIDLVSTGGEYVLAHGYPGDVMQQEVLTCMRLHEFECTGQENVMLSSLQYPTEYAKHKRSLGLFLGSPGPTLTAGNPATPSTSSHHHKYHKFSYVIIARSTTRPLLDPLRALGRGGSRSSPTATTPKKPPPPNGATTTPCSTRTTWR